MQYDSEDKVPAIREVLIVIKPKMVSVILKLMIMILILNIRGRRTGKTMVA
jgi:hypothetical protein